MKHGVGLMLSASLAAALLTVSTQAQEDFGPAFSALRAQYESRVKMTVQQVFDEGLADLNAKYIAGIDRALESAQRDGQLDEAFALKAEKEAVALGKGVRM